MLREGILCVNDDNGRWAISYGDPNDFTELHCGDVIQLQIGDPPVWIRTAVEHNGAYYYCTTKGLCLRPRLRARIFER